METPIIDNVFLFEKMPNMNLIFKALAHPIRSAILKRPR